MKKQLFVTSLALSAVIGLSACGSDSNSSNSHDMHDDMKDSHSGMMHSSDGKIPAGLKQAENPKFKDGANVVLSSDHMKGMDGAEATVVDSFDTTVYAVSFTPTNGGKKVSNHKWVIQEELNPVPKSPLKAGDKVTLAADHMKGMDRAKATIDQADETTVYMVDFKPTTGGKTIKNHKWVTEDELQAKN